MKLTKEEFDNELRFLISKQIIKELVERQLISVEEYESIINALINQYHPLISSLLKGINICTWYK